MKNRGLISVASVDGYGPTVGRLDRALGERGIKPFMRFDHATAAAKVGLHLNPLLLILFGDPRIGTGLMQENPASGIDLPLKILVWQTDGGQVRVGYNDMAWIQERHGLSEAGAAARAIAPLLHGISAAASGLSSGD